MRVDPTHYNCWGTDEVVCPHCGHVHSDSYEWIRDSGNNNEAEVDCCDCGKTFFMEWDWSVSYTTAPFGGWPEVKP